ncbi:hypothetical protein GCM10027517_03820 [Phycicoccus ginsengisoli]
MIATLDVYATNGSRFALLTTDDIDAGGAWLRRRGLPAFWCRRRRGFLARPSDLPDITTMARHERVRVTVHRAAGPREAAIRRRYATTTHRSTE